MGWFGPNEEELRADYLGVLENLCYYLGGQNVMGFAQMHGSVGLKDGLTKAEADEARRVMANMGQEVEKAKTVAMLSWAGTDRNRMAVQRKLAPSGTLDEMYDRIEREMATRSGVPLDQLRRWPFRYTPRDFFEGR